MLAVKMYKLSVIRHISTGDVMYNMPTLVNTAVWHILKLLRVDPKSSHHKELQIFLVTI